MSDPKIIVARDYPEQSKALALIDQLDADLCRLKVGKEMFTHLGPSFVEKIQSKGFDVFLDLKYHDIPNTVAKACEAAASLGVWMVNVHASGGRAMLEAARKALPQNGDTLLIAVTVLTSMGEEDLREINIPVSPDAQVKTLARLSADCGIDGVVCSARETAVLHQEIGNDFLLVTPGIRPAGDSLDDQKRVMTPAEAIKSGSNYLVIGRPVTQAQDPTAKLRMIMDEINGNN